MTGDTTDFFSISHPGPETDNSHDVPTSSSEQDDDVINTQSQEEHTDEHLLKNTDTLPFSNSKSSSSLPTSKESTSKKPVRINYKKLIPAARGAKQGGLGGSQPPLNFGWGG